MPKHSSHKERNATDPYIQLMKWEHNCPAFQSLSGDERAVYIAMRFRYNGRNNGSIQFSSRQAGEAINKSHSTGARAIQRLVNLGFLKIHREYTYCQKRKCSEYELTAISLKPARKSNRLPVGSKDFMRWTKPQIEAMDAAIRKARKTKHSITRESHSVTHATDIGKVVPFAGKKAL